MKATVKKSDYEIYTFNIPLGLRGKKRNAFITRELEKNHPCFSQQCCIDSRLKLHKGKLQSVVAVMDKIKLLEYRGKSKSGIALEGVKNYKFFDENKRYFLLGLATLLIPFLVLPYFFINESKPKQNPVQKDFQIFDEDLIQNDLQAEISSYDFLEKMFLKIADENGFITSFSYTKESSPLDNFGLKVSLDVKKIYPENLDFIMPDASEKVDKHFSPVSYKNQMPSFSVNYSVPQKNETSFKSIGLEKMSRLRGILGQKSTIVSEDCESGFFQISVRDKDFCDLFLALVDGIKELDVEIGTLEIVQGLESHNVNLSFYEQENAEGKTDVSLFADFWNLFCEKKNYESVVPVEKKVAVKNVVQKTLVPNVSKENEKNYGEKIGNVVMKNGKRISYYRGADGKIKGVEE